MSGDTKAFLLAVLGVYAVTLAGIQVVDWVLPAKVVACSITVSDAAGNRYVYIGEGEQR